MYYQRVFAHIFEETIQNVLVCDDYAMANYLAKATYGEEAIAVECNQYRVYKGCKYQNGKFYLEDGETLAPYIPSQEEEVSALKAVNGTLHLAATFMAPSFTDEQALMVKTLYPEWSTFIGKKLEQGERVLYQDRLYKVRQLVNPVLENQPPSIETAALYEEIVENHDGTLEDPIPYNNNMELFEGKYYSQDGVVYKCTRGTGQAVYNPLKDLVGIYVELAS